MTTMILSLFLIAAVLNDSHSHRIPNILTGSGLLAALVLSVASPSDSIGLLNALLGAGLGLLFLLPGYVLGRMGAGDVKLMCMSGAFLGPYGIVDAGVLTLIAGGVLAVLWLAVQRVRSPENAEVLVDATNELTSDTASQLADSFGHNSGSVWKQRFPYALAIALGCFVVMFSNFTLFTL